MSSPFSAPPSLLGIQLSDTSETIEFKLGSVVLGDDGAHYRYVLAAEAIAAYQPVDFDEDFSASVTDATDVILGVAHVAIADTDYGWVVIKGPCTILMTADATAGDIGRLSAVGGLGNVPPADHEGIAGVSYATEAATPAGVAAYLV